MRRGLPQNAARDVRARRSAAPSRTSSGRSSSAPWWHPVLLWAAMLASTALLNPIASPGDRDYELIRSVVIAHHLPAGAPSVRPIGLSGAALLWSPFMLAANAGVDVARARGAHIAADGWSAPYRWATAFGAAFYGFLGLWLSYRLARRFAPPGAALLATIAIWLASSLPVYLYMWPFTADAAAMFSAALVLTLWLSVRDGRNSRGRWFVWGLATGLAVAVTLFNAALIAVAGVECLTRLRPKTFVDGAVNGLMFLAGTAAVVGAALAVQYRIDGVWLTSGHSPIMIWAHPQFVATAFSAEHGVFLWTPVALAGALGLIAVIRRDPAIGAMLAAAAGLLFYFVAAYNGPAERSYGARLLLPLAPMLLCGLAALLGAVVGNGRRAAWVAATTAVLLLVLWNGGLMLQWGSGLIPDQGLVDFREAAANQIRVVPHAAKDFVIRYVNDRKGLVNTLERRVP